MVIKEVPKEVDWVDYMEAEAMKTLLKMEGDVFAITIEAPNDASHMQQNFPQHSEWER